MTNASIEATLYEGKKRSDGSPVFLSRQTAAATHLASLSRLVDTDSALMMDNRSIEERVKQLQTSAIVEGTVKKMFGEIATDGFDAKVNQRTLASNNLAYIKRNLDKEASDTTKRIQEDLKNEAHFYSTKATLYSRPQEKKQAARQLQTRTSSNTVLEQIQTIKLPKYNMKLGALRRSSNDRISLAREAAIAEAYRD